MPSEPPIPLELPLAGEPTAAATRCERVDAANNRARVLDAARRLFSQRGGASVSMDAVADAAGVGKGTVFRRFGDREGLIEALLHEDMRHFQDGFLRGLPPLGPGGDPEERLDAFLIELLALLDRNLELLLSANLSSTHPPRLYAALALHLRILIAQAAPTQDAEVLADLLLSALSAPMLARLRREQGRSLREVQAGVCALLHGILAGSTS